MQRNTTIYILTAVLLICPYSCLAELVISEASGCQSSGCCCSHEQVQQDQDAPESPADPDPDCLCHGAIVAPCAETTDCDYQAAPLTIVGLADGMDLSVISTSSATFSFEHSRHFPPFSTGRDVCTLNSVLLL